MCLFSIISPTFIASHAGFTFWVVAFETLSYGVIMKPSVSTSNISSSDKTADVAAHGTEGETGLKAARAGQADDVDASPSLSTKNVSKLSHGPYLDVPLQQAFRASTETVSNISVLSGDDGAVRSSSRNPQPASWFRIASRSPAPPRTLKGRLHHFWQTNKGIVLVILAQLFGALMAATARLLETAEDNGEPMGTFQVRLSPRLKLSSTEIYHRFCSFE